MPPGYTNVAKPTGTPYTKVAVGNIGYDESSLSYDDSTVYYDGFISSLIYTGVAKPTGSVYTLVAKPT